MRARIQQREYRNWPGDIRRRLMALTLRDYSEMRVTIRNKKSTLTFVLFEGKHPVAWSLVQRDFKDNTYNIMIYVRRDKRRLGYGRQVFTKSKKWVKAQKAKHFVFPDEYNAKFFNSVGEKVYSGYL